MFHAGLTCEIYSDGHQSASRHPRPNSGGTVLKHVWIMGVCFLLAVSSAIAAEPAYTGPYWMCPDAHGADQATLFKTIDISKFPMRIDTLGDMTVEGVQARVNASRSAAIMNKDGDPIENAFKKLFGDYGTTMAVGPKRRLAALCFAVGPPPADQQTDGPFVFMPGFIVQKDQSPDPHLDVVTVPQHLYLVVSYTGSQDDVGNMRFTLTNEFWPRYAPLLGFHRDDRAPNLMIWEVDQSGNESTQRLEMWTPILPVSVNQAAPWKGPPASDTNK